MQKLKKLLSGFTPSQISGATVSESKEAFPGCGFRYKYTLSIPGLPGTNPHLVDWFQAAAGSIVEAEGILDLFKNLK